MTNQEAINWIKNDGCGQCTGGANNPYDCSNEKCEMREAYDMAIKSLKQEPKTGHWGRKTKVDAYDIAGVKTWGIKCQCDRCDFTTIVVEDFGYYKYCPNCGARMESEEEK